MTWIQLKFKWTATQYSKTINMHKTTIWLQCKMIQVCLKQYPFTVWRLIDCTVFYVSFGNILFSHYCQRRDAKRFIMNAYDHWARRSLSCHNFLATGSRLLTTFSKDSHKLVWIYDKEELIMTLSYQILTGRWKIQNQKLISILLCHLFFSIQVRINCCSGKRYGPWTWFFFQDKNRNFDSNCYAFRIYS